MLDYIAYNTLHYIATLLTLPVLYNKLVVRLDISLGPKFRKASV